MLLFVNRNKSEVNLIYLVVIAVSGVIVVCRIGIQLMPEGLSRLFLAYGFFKTNPFTRDLDSR